MSLNHQEFVRLALAEVNDPGVGLILERHAHKLTKCPECLVDEFTHAEGCELAELIEDCATWRKNPQGEQPAVLGPLVYFA